MADGRLLELDLEVEADRGIHILEGEAIATLLDPLDPRLEEV